MEPMIEISVSEDEYHIGVHPFVWESKSLRNFIVEQLYFIIDQCKNVEDKFDEQTTAKILFFNPKKGK